MDTNDRREPKILDRNCYWLILIPRNARPGGADWYGQVWGKGDDAPSSSWQRGTQEELERQAKTVIDCKFDTD